MKIHFVKKGETLYEIGNKHGITVDQLVKANSSIVDPNKIDVGMKLIIPDPSVMPSASQPTSPKPSAVNPPAPNLKTPVYPVSDQSGTKMPSYPETTATFPKPAALAASDQWPSGPAMEGEVSQTEVPSYPPFAECPVPAYKVNAHAWDYPSVPMWPVPGMSSVAGTSPFPAIPPIPSAPIYPMANVCGMPSGPYLQSAPVMPTDPYMPAPSQYPTKQQMPQPYPQQKYPQQQYPQQPYPQQQQYPVMPQIQQIQQIPQMPQLPQYPVMPSAQATSEWSWPGIDTPYNTPFNLYDYMTPGGAASPYPLTLPPHAVPTTDETMPITYESRNDADTDDEEEEDEAEVRAASLPGSSSNGRVHYRKKRKKQPISALKSQLLQLQNKRGSGRHATIRSGKSRPWIPFS